jgi:hypothetical protein
VHSLGHMILILDQLYVLLLLPLAGLRQFVGELYNSRYSNEIRSSMI